MAQLSDQTQGTDLMPPPILCNTAQYTRKTEVGVIHWNTVEYYRKLISVEYIELCRTLWNTLENIHLAHHVRPQGERANGVTEYKTSKLVKECLKSGIMKAIEGKVALGPFQEEEMLLNKLLRGQRHLRSSTSKFVENPHKKKVGKTKDLPRISVAMQLRIHPCQ